MACVAFWLDNTHPIIGDKYHGAANRSVVPVKYVKTENFNTAEFIETKDLMYKYNLTSGQIGKKIRFFGYEKVTCLQKKWVLKKFEQHLK